MTGERGYWNDRKRGYLDDRKRRLFRRPKKGVIPVLDTGIQPCRNLIKNVVTTFHASLLVNKQIFLDPSVWALPFWMETSVSYLDDKRMMLFQTGMTPSVVNSLLLYWLSYYATLSTLFCHSPELIRNTLAVLNSTDHMPLRSLPHQSVNNNHYPSTISRHKFQYQNIFHIHLYYHKVKVL